MNTIQVNIETSLLSPMLAVGTFGYDVNLGKMTYRWEFTPDWLRRYRHITLSGDLLNADGPQYTSKALFCLLQDAMPDRWGRNLIKKREHILAQQQGRAPRHLTDVDYLIQVDDTTRMGALRFSFDGQATGAEYAEMHVPPITYLREFMDMAHEYERREMNGGTIREEWLLNLYRQGSSLGGARPKANVIDTDGNLWIAKIPSVNDDYDVALWEYWALQLASMAGINIPQIKLLSLDGTHFHTLLSKRFDRQGNNRIHFASAMTLTGLHDGADAASGNGYLDIVDAVLSDTGFVNPQEALEQLFRRVAFSIAIGNHDDHFRNHGFLLSEKGWKWAPAYDINPSNIMVQSLLISRESNQSSLDILLDAAGDYMISEVAARRIIDEVLAAVSQWRIVANRCAISAAEQKRFAARIIDRW